MGVAVDTASVQDTTVNPVLEQPQYRGLTPWKPGQSGNPSGVAKDPQTLTGILAKLVDKQAIAERLWELANGDKVKPELRLDAIKYIYARIEGNPVQAMRFQAEGSVVPLIFLHPGREAPALSKRDDSETIEGEAKLLTDGESTATE